MLQQLQLEVESKVDEELVHAQVLADKDCDSQHLAEGLELDSRVARDSFADTVACDGRKDIAEILADTAACDRRTDLSVVLVDNQDMRRVVAVGDEILAILHLEDGEQ